MFARYSRGVGDNVLYVCGTDEYGTATETKAVEEHTTPRAVCDKYHALHAAIYSWFDIAFDTFGRTSCPDPWADPSWPQTVISQSVFADNLAAGNLAPAAVDQVYCTGCRKFLADRFIEGCCPLCGYDDARGDQCDGCGKLLNATDLLRPRCKADGAHVVEVRTSRHLFLDLPKLEPTLREWITASSSKGLWSPNAVSITGGWLDGGLKPRCITRDLRWGTPVPHPDFADKVFYVWFDAPIGYVSMTAGYGLARGGGADWWKAWWRPSPAAPVDLYMFMGKDNIPFHTVIFPASLLGAGGGWALPVGVSTTEFLNYEGGKFSKSRGVGVFGDNAMASGIPSEVWRYYLLSNRPESSDSVFTWADFADKVNNELLKNLGNLVQRALSFSWATYGGRTPPAPGVDSPSTPRDVELVREVNELLGEYHTALSGLKLRSGLKVVMDVSAVGNKYMQDEKPWELAKSDPARAGVVVTGCVALVALLAALAEPFMPGFTDKVLFTLDLPHGSIPRSWAPWGGAGAVPADHPFNKPAPLFSVISAERVEALRAAHAGAGEEVVAAPKAKPARGGKPAPAPGGPPPLSDLERVELLVGVIASVVPHPDPAFSKLWMEQIDVGEAAPRTVLSGLRAAYPDAGDLVGRRVVVVANLKPRAMGGVESAGMVLCAGDGTRTELITPPPCPAGTRLTCAGYSAASAPTGEVVNPSKKGNPWSVVAEGLATNSDAVACYKGVPLLAGGEPVLAGGLAASRIA